MSRSNVNRADVERIARALDGRLAEADQAAFQADVIRDPALRRAYVEHACLQGALRAERDRLPQWLDADASTPPTAKRAVFISWIAIGVAACALLGFASWQALRVTAAAEPTVATLLHAQNTKWANSTLPTAENSRLGPGTLALVEGIATLQFASGATLTLEAPTKLEIVDAMHCRLIEGSVTADVPPSAHGFTVDTADLKVVDLGTRFGVTAGSAGNSHVFVFEGEVKLNDASGGELRRLTEGKSFLAGSGAGVGNAEPARFQPMAYMDGWTTIPTSYGQGRDAYVRRGYDGSTSAQPLLLVKHSDLPLSYRNERRAFLSFDLTGIDLATLTEAELMLDPEPSGLGFSTMISDSRFAVYGLTDEALDLWDEASLTWAIAPASDDEGLRPEQTRRLAEFWLPRGASGAPFSVRSAEIAAFLKNDTNGIASFVIVRETSETDPSGLVHAFASKEHPSARPPTLRVR